MALDPYFAQILGQSAGRATTQFPALPQEEQESLIARILGNVVSPLTWVGETLDKPGRAIRGLLGGKPSELLNLIPFSDTIGLTDPAQQVTGRQLLEGAGILEPNTPGLDPGDVGGFLAEVALDPLTYLGIGTLTRAGKEAAKTGSRVGKGLAGSIRAGERSLFNVGLPFTEGAAVGTGEAAAKIAERFVDAPLGLLKESRVGRTARRLFDRDVMNASTVAGQRIMSEAMPGLLKDTAEVETGLRHTLREAVERQALDTAGQDWMRRLAEAPDDAKNALVNQLKVSHPQADYIIDTTEQLVKAKNKWHQELANLNMDVKWLDDVIEHYPRYHHEMDPQTFVGALRDVFRRRHDAVFSERNKLFKEIPGGTEDLNAVIGKYGGWESRAMEGGLAPSAMKDYRQIIAHSLAKEAYGVDAATWKEVPKAIKRKSTELAEHIGQKYWSGFDPATNPYFNADPITDLVLYARGQKTAKTVGSAILKLAGEVAIPMDYALKPGKLYEIGGKKLIPLRDALHEGGFRFSKAATQGPFFPGTQKQALPFSEFLKQENPLAKELAGRFDHLPDKINRWAVPVEHAEDIKRWVKSWQSADEVRPVLDTYDALLNAFKVGVTQMWPAFHTRNAVSAIYYNLIGGMNRPTELIGDHLTALAIRRGDFTKPLPKALEQYGNWKNIADMAAAHHVAFTGHGASAERVGKVGAAIDEAITEGRAMLKVPGLQKGFGLKPNLPPKVAESTVGRVAETATRPISAVAQTGINVGSVVEDTVRMAGFIGALKQGFSPAQAAEKVFQWQFDYGARALTEFERNVMKRALPFYRFMRANIPLVLQQLIQKPGGEIAQSIRAARMGRSGREWSPNQVGQSLGIPLPGGESPGSRYLTSLGLPFEQPFEMASIVSDPSSRFPRGINVGATIGRNIEQLIGSSSPLISGAYAFASGREPFFGRELKDLHQYPTDSPYINAVLMRSPASRAITTVRKSLDERKGPGVKALNLLTGAQVTDLSGGLERHQELATSRALQQIMEKNPKFREFSRFYVREEDIPGLSEFDRDIMRLQNNLITNQRKRKTAGMNEQQKLLSGL